MVVIHTKAVAIFNGQLINEAEDKIQYVKYRPSQPFDSNTPINFTIPRNSSQYVSLCESYVFVQCHIEETDQFGNPITASSNSNSNVVVEVNNEEDGGYDTGKDEEDMEQEEEEEENESKITRAIPSNIPPCPFPASAKDVQGYLEEAEHRYIKWKRALTSFKKETDIQEKVKKKALAES